MTIKKICQKTLHHNKSTKIYEIYSCLTNIQRKFFEYKTVWNAVPNLCYKKQNPYRFSNP